MTPAVVIVAAVAIWIAVRPPRGCWRVYELARVPPSGSVVHSPVGSLGAHTGSASPEPGGSDRKRWDTKRPIPSGSGRKVPKSEDVATCAEMLAVAVTAGCPIAEAVMTVGETSGAGAALAPQASALRRGKSLEEVLDSLAGRSDDSWHSLGTLLALSAASGAPAAGGLRRLAAQERTRLRRRREQRVRRLPVLLLLPLSGLVLPAFLLVTIVPFGLAGGASLDLPSIEDRAVPTTEEP